MSKPPPQKKKKNRNRGENWGKRFQAGRRDSKCEITKEGLSSAVSGTGRGPTSVECGEWKEEGWRGGQSEQKG